jgi:hypothetical protein
VVFKVSSDMFRVCDTQQAHEVITEMKLLCFAAVLVTAVNTAFWFPVRQLAG